MDAPALDHPVAPSGGDEASRLPALEVALLALLGFLPSIVAGYVYDDILLIRDNPHTQSLGGMGRAFSSYFWQIGDQGSGGLLYYRPLVTATYILNWVMGSGKPWLFHFFNASLHAAVTYLVVLFARRMTGSRTLAIAIALVFAFHPSRTESVEWIAGRTDVLMTLFLMLSLEFAHRGAGLEATRRQKWFLGASVATFFLALLCKEAAVMLPLLGLAEFLAARPGQERRTFGRVLVVWSVIAAFYALLRTTYFPVRNDPTEVTVRYGFLTVFAYLERALVPYPQTFFHRPLYVENGQFVYPLPLVVAGVLIVVAYTALVVTTFRRDRVAALLLLAAVVAFGPLLNFTYTGIFVTTSDHFLYLPLLLVCVGLGRRYAERLSGWARVPAARYGFLGVIALYLAIDLLRIFDYRDQESIYLHELANNPNNPLVLKSLSEEKAREGKTDAAFAFLLRASRPESRKYTLLLPPWLDYQDYMRLLGLQSARIADGNIADLGILYRELQALLAEGRPTARTIVGQLSVGRRLDPAMQHRAMQFGAKEVVAAEAAFLATRLGDEDKAREYLVAIGSDHLSSLTSVPNVALAYARLQDFDGARRFLQTAQRALSYRYPEKSLDGILKRIDDAETLFGRAAEATGPLQRRLRAGAYMGLGAYLSALRELRPVVDLYPGDGEAGPLYVQLLLAAGLDHEALDVATRALGPERAHDALGEMRSRLPPRVLTLRKPVEPVDWFAPYGTGASP
jgi:tetratricopeptide (TPR) repeat protein